MAANREEILANFQACTGLENLDECIMLLDQNDWDLHRAVTNVLPMDIPPTESVAESPIEPPPPPPPQFYGSSSHFDGFEPPEFQYRPGPVISSSTGSSSFQPGAFVPPPVVPVLPPIVPTASSSSSLLSSGAASTSLASNSNYGEPFRKRLLNFNIEYRERTIPVSIPDSETVGTIKAILFGEINVSPDKQVLRGFPGTAIDPKNDVILSTLNLPKENRLFLLTPDVTNPTVIRPQQPNGDNPQFLERLQQNYRLIITHIEERKEFSLNFPGSRTIQEVKQDVDTLIDVPVRQQEWTGWPDATGNDDSLTLAACGLNYPCHRLSVSRHSPSQNRTRPINLTTDAASESDDEYEDACPPYDDQDMFVDDVQQRKFEPLLPTNVDDITSALIHFSQEFGSRYSERHPVFYLGPIEDAFKEAFSVPAKDRKLLAIYIHHDNSVQSNVFCSQVLCSDTIVSYLNSNFINWAWDITGDENKAKLLNWCTQHFGSVAASTVRSFRTDQFPLFLVIMKVRSNTEVFKVLQGNTSLDELMTNLINAVDVFTEHQQSEMREETEREERELMKKEQDEAYQASLAIDSAKEEKRKAEEEQQRMKELVEREQKEREDREKQEVEEQKEAIRLSLEEQLPDEPPDTCTEPITTIRVKLPNGENVTRKFLAQHPLQILLNYVASKGYQAEEYKVLTNWPKRDLSTMDRTQSLGKMGMYPQDTVFVEER
ncbi:FAS-associated factor 1-like [Glandiceps talaboti]